MIDEYDQQVLASFQAAYEEPPLTQGIENSGKEILVISSYPEDQGDDEVNEADEEIAALVMAAQTEQRKLYEQPVLHITNPIGYVSNARNAASQSDLFQFWTPAEETSLGIGSIVRHTATTPQQVNTYGIIIDTTGTTLGLDDYAIHVYEQDARPPLDSIVPAPSTRRPVVHYQAKVLASTQKALRPVQSGPVYAVSAAELAEVHKQAQDVWLDPQYLLLGFYEDAQGKFGIFGEERARVLGPKQGHIIFSGLPGAGKTSLFLTLVISLYAQLRNREKVAQNIRDVPSVATLAINVKGADLLFLDHIGADELEEHDRSMWQAAGVDIKKRPLGRVIIYTPLKEDGFNRYSLRSNPAADIEGYSETRDFALGIQDIWPYLGMFFDQISTGASALIAEVAQYLEKEHPDGFTLADVRNLFDTQINKPKSERSKSGVWEDFNTNTIQAVAQRFRSLPATLKGLIDTTGKGFGLSQLTDLKPYDMVVIDIERIMANPGDPLVAESTIKIITAYILKRLTEAMTQRTCKVDHIIVFADELNRLAPRDGNGGIGEYLAQLARTTRDRGIVLFGAGQFRSGINEDILKAASVHYSMRIPEHELSDRIYAPLSSEFKARLTQLEPGETLLQYPALRTAVFARFPRPFVMSGAREWQQDFPPIEDRPLADCIYERLCRLEPQHPPQLSEVRMSIDSLMQSQDSQKKQNIQVDLINLLRSVEMDYVSQRTNHTTTPWQSLHDTLTKRYPHKPASVDIAMTPTPANFEERDEEWE